MKRFILTLLSILLCILLIRAELLWEVTGGDSTRPSYLFGTHHTVPDTFINSVAGFDKAFDSVDKVYGEIVMSELASAEGHQKLMAAGTAPADSTLTSLLTRAQVDSLDMFVRRYMGPGVSAASFDRLKPAMLQTVVTMIINRLAFPDFDPAHQLDGAIQAMAADEGKTVGALESIDDQCRALFGTPLTEQASELAALISDEDNQTALVHRLAATYLRGDLDGLLKLMLEDSTDMDDLSVRRLIYDRNHRWMGTITAALRDGGAMFVVGAGHLPGPEGLIELLRNEGYTVTPVK